MSGTIFDIQRFSVHDGPGIRTTVFLKGCPLRCAWCHNPEGLMPFPQVQFFPEKCIHCGRCQGHTLSEVSRCPSGALAVCGRMVEAAEVMETVLRDRCFYGKEGGMTLSGGESVSCNRTLRLSCFNLPKTQAFTQRWIPAGVFHGKIWNGPLHTPICIFMTSKRWIPRRIGVGPVRATNGFRRICGALHKPVGKSGCAYR